MLQPGPRAAVPTPWDGSQEVCVIEDNPDDSFITVKALKKCHPEAKVTVVSHGSAAIELHSEVVAGKAVLPSLVLLDLKLPGVSGFEVLRAFREHEVTKDTVIVVVTSSDEDLDIEQAWALGANDYVKKPLDLAEYLAAIESVCNMWLPSPAVL